MPQKQSSKFSWSELLSESVKDRPSGEWKRASEIATEIGYSDRRARDILRAAVKDGLVETIQHKKISYYRKAAK